MDRVEKFISRLPKKEALNIAEIINKIKIGDLKSLDIKKLKGLDGHYRVRFGKNRIIFYKKGNFFNIISIGKRSDTTYDI